MWTERRLERIRSHDAVILHARPQMGVNRLVSALARDRSFVWVVLEETDKGDRLSIGNKLSDALKVAFGVRLFPRGTPFLSGLGLLKRYLPTLEPLTLAVSGGEYSSEFANALLGLRSKECRVVIGLNFCPDVFHEDLSDVSSPDILLLSEADLEVSLPEARLLTRGAAVPIADIARLLELSGRAIETLISLLESQFDIRSSTAEVAGSGVGTVGYDPLAEVEVMLQVGEWRRAAELAVESVPERAASVVLGAAHEFHEQGLHEALWRLLERLPAEAAETEEGLFWRLSCAAWLDRADEVRPQVERYLSSHEAPELRALYAGACLRTDAGRREVERAFRASRTPFTLYQQGRAARAVGEGVGLLEESLRLAESDGRPYEVSRAASALAARLIDSGRYAEAARWGEWALSHFDRTDQGNVQRRLLILNNWAYARLLIGESVGLGSLLEEAEQVLSRAFPDVEAIIRSTLSDYLLATGSADRALEQYRLNFRQARRQMKGIRGLSLVRALQEFESDGKTQALRVAAEAATLTTIDDGDYHLPAVLAEGIAMTFEDPGQAERLLLQVLQHVSAYVPAPVRAQAALYLARSRVLQDDPNGAKAAVEEQEAVLRPLSETGLRMLSGPESEFEEIWGWCLGEPAPLELRFLGRREVVLNGRQLQLSGQQCAILALLAANPGGVGARQLVSELEWDSNRSAMFSALNRLRKRIPISPQPYRLEPAYKADFLVASGLLQEGMLRQALELMRGGLLEEIDAPGVVALREKLDEMFRQAVLDSKDVESTFSLAKRFDDDLELWEHALELLHPNDRRALVARARVEQLRREY
jgi:hypothetical protein